MRNLRPLMALICIVIIPILSGCARQTPRTDPAWSRLVEGYHHDVVIDGLSMHYIDIGSGSPVVLIHGIGDSTYSWHQNVLALINAGFRLILVDQPGFGQSAIPAKGWQYSIENQAEAILQLVNRLGIDRFQLVGHSLGGGEALYLAWKHGDRINRLAVVSPASQRTSCPFGAITDVIASVFGTRWFTEQALRSAYFRPEKVNDTMVDEYARLLDRPGRLGSGVLGGVCRSYFSAEYDRMVENYRDIKPDLLIIWGKEDSWHPVTFGTRLQSLVSGSRLEVIPEAGHNVHQERADAVNPMLISFLNGKK